jgi:hypothetical protein
VLDELAVEVEVDEEAGSLAIDVIAPVSDTLVVLLTVSCAFWPTLSFAMSA